ncbi:hypothetical protein, partial [Calditerricola satsumensis]|uniref:hypothetical protein n=1 Tax=Calditerricola satsumensis TaxID=373054 RepID=UPI001C450150
MPVEKVAGDLEVRYRFLFILRLHRTSEWRVDAVGSQVQQEPLEPRAVPLAAQPVGGQAKRVHILRQAVR